MCGAGREYLVIEDNSGCHDDVHDDVPDDADDDDVADGDDFHLDMSGRAIGALGVEHCISGGW